MLRSHAWFPGNGTIPATPGHRPGCRCGTSRRLFRRLPWHTADRIMATAAIHSDSVTTAEIGHALALAARYEQNPPTDVSAQTARLIAYVSRVQAARMQAHRAHPAP